MTFTPIYRQDPAHPQAQACAACELRSAALFGALDADGLDRIHTDIASLELAPGSPVYSRGDRGAVVFTVRTGVVRFERFTQRGDRRIVRLAGPGDLIGQEALLERAYQDEAIACTSVQLCQIPIAMIDELGQAQPALQRELMLRWQAALDASEAWVADLASGPARRRVLRLLLKLADYADAGDVIWLPRRDEIGAMLDMTLETASRLVSRLKREGVLERVGVRATRVNMPALHLAVRLVDVV
jgi:CRP/FNR family transcriptional regulator